MPLIGYNFIQSLNSVKTAIEYCESHPGTGPQLMSYAIEQGKEDIVSALIQLGIPLETYGLLHKAAFLGHANLVSLLLNHGVPIDTQNLEGRTPLACAVIGNQLSVVNELITRGADVNRSDNNGRTPLIQAVRRNRLAIFRALIDAGANPSLADEQGADAKEIARRLFREGYFD